MAIRVLFEKARSPRDHVWVIYSIYEATRDFRILEALANSVIEQSARGVYPMIGTLRAVVGSVREATVDRVMARIDGLRADAKSNVDRRALAFCEFFVRKRALELTHGVQEHERGVLAALESVRQDEFALGEAAAKAELYGSVGVLNSRAVLDEIDRATGGVSGLGQTQECVHAQICLVRAAVLWTNAESFDRTESHGRAIDLATLAVNELRRAHGDRLRHQWCRVWRP